MKDYAKQILVVARHVLSSPHRWIKGAAERGGINLADHFPNQMCLVGSVDYATQLTAVAGENGKFEAQRVAFNAIVASLPPNGWGTSIPHFNDHPEVSHDMVLAVLDRAIAFLDDADASPPGDSHR